MNLYDREVLQLIYVAHPFGGDIQNLDDAEWMVAELSALFDAVFWAPWIPMCRYWINDGNSLERGMALDSHAVRLSKQIWFCDDLTKSKGMQEEDKIAQRYGIKCKYFQRNQIIDIIDNPTSMLVESLKLELNG
jgi:hypothetical protein